jgi:hypothetical protein
MDSSGLVCRITSNRLDLKAEKGSDGKKTKGVKGKSGLRLCLSHRCLWQEQEWQMLLLRPPKQN